MSPDEEKPTRNGKWTKVLMVAVPTFIGLMFLSHTLQFTELDVEFIPKNATFKRYLQVFIINGRSNPNLITEVTEARWESTQVNEQVKQYVDKIRAKGYHEEIDPDEPQKYRTFANAKGNTIILRPIWDPGKQGFEIIFSHDETRPMQCKVKRNILWLIHPY